MFEAILDTEHICLQNSDVQWCAIECIACIGHMVGLPHLN